MIYLALIAGALTMLLQTWAQARVEASRAAVIMAMEPVWAAAFAVAFGGESLTGRMIIGGGAILAAMYLVELAPRASPECSTPAPLGRPRCLTPRRFGGSEGGEGVRRSGCRRR